MKETQKSIEKLTKKSSLPTKLLLMSKIITASLTQEIYQLTSSTFHSEGTYTPIGCGYGSAGNYKYFLSTDGVDTNVFYQEAGISPLSTIISDFVGTSVVITKDKTYAMIGGDDGRLAKVDYDGISLSVRIFTSETTSKFLSLEEIIPTDGSQAQDMLAVSEDGRASIYRHIQTSSGAWNAYRNMNLMYGTSAVDILQGTTMGDDQNAVFVIRESTGLVRTCRYSISGLFTLQILYPIKCTSVLNKVIKIKSTPVSQFILILHENGQRLTLWDSINGRSLVVKSFDTETILQFEFTQGGDDLVWMISQNSVGEKRIRFQKLFLKDITLDNIIPPIPNSIEASKFCITSTGEKITIMEKGIDIQNVLYQENLPSACTDNCHICDSTDTNTPKKCLVCETGFFLNRKTTGVGECVSSCPEPSGIIGSNTCSESYCAKGMGMDNSASPLSCRLCSYGHDCVDCLEYNKCTLCRAGINKDFIDESGQCISECLTKTYVEEIDGSKYCKSCPMNCLVCSSDTICTECDDGFLLRSDDLCYDSCDEGYYPINSLKKCSRCFSTCATCDGGLEDKCLTCKPNLNFEAGKCLGQCSGNKVSEGGLCQDQCDGTRVSEDKICQDNCSPGKVIEGNICQDSCDGERVAEDNICADSCSGEKMIQDGRCVDECDEGRLVHEGIHCLTSCPEGLFNENLVCQPQCDGLNRVSIEGTCVDECLLTQVNETRICKTECDENRANFSRICYDNCPERYFKNQKQCSQCNDTRCLNCDGGARNCSSCEVGYFSNSQLICQKECEKNEGWIRTNECQPCELGCLRCENVTLNCYQFEKSSTLLYLSFIPNSDKFLYDKKNDIIFDIYFFKDILGKELYEASLLRRIPLNTINPYVKVTKDGEELDCQLNWKDNFSLQLICNFKMKVEEKEIEISLSSLNKTLAEDTSLIYESYFLFNKTTQKIKFNFEKNLLKDPEIMKKLEKNEKTSKAASEAIKYTSGGAEAIISILTLTTENLSSEGISFLITMKFIGRLRLINMNFGIVLEDFMKHVGGSYKDSNQEIESLTKRRLEETEEEKKSYGKLSKYEIYLNIFSKGFFILKASLYALSWVFKLFIKYFLIEEITDGKLVRENDIKMVKFQRKIHYTLVNLMFSDMFYFGTRSLFQKNWSFINPIRLIIMILYSLIIFDMLEIIYQLKISGNILKKFQSKFKEEEEKDDFNWEDNEEKSIDFSVMKRMINLKDKKNLPDRIYEREIHSFELKIEDLNENYVKEIDQDTTICKLSYLNMEILRTNTSFHKKKTKYQNLFTVSFSYIYNLRMGIYLLLIIAMNRIPRFYLILITIFELTLLGFLIYNYVRYQFISSIVLFLGKVVQNILFVVFFVVGLLIEKEQRGKKNVNMKLQNFAVTIILILIISEFLFLILNTLANIFKTISEKHKEKKNINKIADKENKIEEHKKYDEYEYLSYIWIRNYAASKNNAKKKEDKKSEEKKENKEKEDKKSDKPPKNEKNGNLPQNENIKVGKSKKKQKKNFGNNNKKKTKEMRPKEGDWFYDENGFGYE